MVYEFPTAAVTNFHKLSGLKQTQIYYLTIPVARVRNGYDRAKTKALARLAPPGGTRKGPLLCLCTFWKKPALLGS